MADWQPIETAPKDGTKIMLFGRWKPYEQLSGGGPCYLLVSWSTVMSDGTGHQWMTDNLKGLGETLFPNLRQGGAETYNVDWTHWQPLPAPPNPEA